MKTHLHYIVTCLATPIFLISCADDLPPVTPLGNGKYVYQIPYSQWATELGADGSLKVGEKPGVTAKASRKWSKGYVTYFGDCNDPQKVDVPGAGQTSSVAAAADKTGSAITKALKDAEKNPQKKAEVAKLLIDAAAYYKALNNFDNLNPAKGSEMSPEKASAALEAAAKAYARESLTAPEKESIFSQLLRQFGPTASPAPLPSGLKPPVLIQKPVQANRSAILSSGSSLKARASNIATN